MSFNGAGLFVINSSGQPVVAGTTIQSTVFNALTADLAGGLSNCITKDGQTTVTNDIPFNSHKLTGLAAATTNGDAIRYEQWRAAFAHICEFRLTGATATPVTTADLAAISVVFMTPYKGNLIALYDGSSAWNVRSTAEISIGVPAVANKMYDVFCYDNAGAPTLEVLAWTNDTTRATALTTQDGVLVKTGATTRRYLGTFRTNGAAQAVDTLGTRWLYNYYNRVRRPMRVYATTASWTYTTATWRQANADATMQLDFVQGVDEDGISAHVMGVAANTLTGTNLCVGIGIDATTFPSATSAIGGATSAFANASMNVGAFHRFFPGVGRHYAAWLEYSVAAGVTTWYGDAEPAANPMAHSGIYGEIFA